MISLRGPYFMNVLTLICVFIFVTVNSNEDNGQDAKTGTTENVLEDIVDVLRNEGEKPIQAENEGEKVEGVTEIDIEEKFTVDEVIDLGKGAEEIVEVKGAIEVKEKEIPEESPESSSVVPKEPVSEENVKTSTSASTRVVKVTTVEKEEAPEDTYAVWNSAGKICILARFNATFSIVYPSEGGEQKTEVHVPKKDGNAKGKCESISRSPLLQISWQKYVLTMTFNKSEEENWIVTSIELTYDTSDPWFDRATNDFCSCLSFPFDYA